MPARYFTIEEANALLPKIKPLMAELVERRARIVSLRHEIADLLEDLHSNVGGPVGSKVVQDFMAIERLANKVKSFGCVIKDLNVGLVDFLAERDGREVYLCWRFDESRIEFYHELHTGFMNRERL